MEQTVGFSEREECGEESFNKDKRLKEKDESFFKIKDKIKMIKIFIKEKKLKEK